MHANQQIFMLSIAIKILIRDAFDCIIYETENSTHESNIISYPTMPLNPACAPYILEVVANGELAHTKEIPGYFILTLNTMSSIITLLLFKIFTNPTDFLH